MKRIKTVIIGLWSIASCFGQSEVQADSVIASADSLGIISADMPDFTAIDDYYVPQLSGSSLFDAPVLMFSGNSYSGLNCTYHSPMFESGLMTQNSLPKWIVFSGGVQSYPGLMQVESGSIGFAANTGNFGYGAYAGAVKYGSFNSLVTSYYIGGQMSYRFSPSLSMTVFGSYYFRNPYLGMAAYPYVRTSDFGGYVTYSPNSAFSLSVGAKSYYDPFRRRFETDPIIAPTVKVGKVRIGVDVGHAAKHYLLGLFQSWSR